MSIRSLAGRGAPLAAAAVLLMILMAIAPTGQAISFTTNKRVDSGTGSSTDPVIVLNSTGTIVVAWADDRNGNYDIYCARSTNSGVSWTGDNPVHGATTGDQLALDMAYGVFNKVHFVWQDGRGATTDIYYANSPDACSNFGSDQRVDDSSSGQQREPAVALNGSTIYVVWADNRGGNYDIYFSKSSDNGSTWSANKRIDDDSGSSDQRYPDIAVDSTGKIVVVWQDSRNGNWDIFASVSTDKGTTFGANKRVDDTAAGGSNQEQPAIAVDLDKKFHVAWQDTRTYAGYNIYYSNSTNPGTTWSANKKVDDTGSGGCTIPSIAVDINRMVHIAWQDYRSSGNPDIYYSNITKAGTFAANKRVDNSTQGSQAYVDITTDSNANTFLAWQSDENGNNDIFFTRNSNKQPNQPTLTSPANGGWVKTSTPTFAWTFSDPDSGDSQTAFRVQVYNATSTAYDSDVVLSTSGSHTVSSVIGDGVWSWKVRTRDTNGAWSFYSNPWTVKIDTVGPVSSAPVDSGTWSSSSSVTWTWSAATDISSGVSGYYICVGTSAGSCNVVSDAWTTSTSYTYIGGTDGNAYYAKVKAKDIAGNNGSYSGNSDGITVDLTAPTAAGPTDEGQYTKSTTLKWTWSASSDTLSGLAGYYICIGTTAGGCDVVSDAWTDSTGYTYLNAQNGFTYYAKIKAKDNATNIGAYGANSDGITVDLVSPSASRPVDEGEFVPTTEIKFHWAQTVDEISGINGYYVYVGTLPDGNDAVDGAFVTEPNYTFTGGLNGKTYYAYIKAMDNATNVGMASLSSDGVTVDLTVPPAPHVEDEGLTNLDRQAIGWWDAVEDKESGVVGYNVQLRQGATVVKEVNTTLTTYKFQDPTAFLDHGLVYNIWVRALNGAGNYSLWGHSDGLHVDFMINDSAKARHIGLFSNSTSILWTWPAIVDEPAGIAGYLVNIGSVAGGADLVFEGWTAKNSYLFTGGTNGLTYYITVTAKDKAGNLAAPVANATGIMVDIMAPDAGIVSDEGSYTGSPNVTFSWSQFKDSSSGIDYYFIAIGSQQYADDIAVTKVYGTQFTYDAKQASGPFFAKVRAVDKAGNIGPWSQSTGGIVIDRTGPTNTTLLEPGQYANTLDHLDIEWSESFDETSGVQYYLYALGSSSGGADIVNWTKVYGTSVTIKGLNLQNGKSVYLSLKPVNGAGLSGNLVKVQITIDTVAPSGPKIFNYPAFASNTSITWTWSGASDDRSGIDGYFFSLGTIQGQSDLISNLFVSAEGFTYNAGLNDRAYYATLIPVDKAGNRGTPLVANMVRVDLLPPRMIVVERPAAYTHARNVTWSWDGSDGISGIEGYWIVVSEGDFTNITQVFVKGNRYTWSKDIIEGHTYFIQVRPQDKAGNLGDFAYGEGITVDTVSPTGTVNINNNASFVPSRIVSLQVTTSHKDVALMLVSNTADFSKATWEPFAASRVWYLTPGDGAKEVYVVLRDASGQQSPTYKVIVTLDTISPKLDVELPGDVVSSSELVVKGKTDPRSQVLVNGKAVKVEDNGEFSTTITLKDGTNLITVVATDQAGNEVKFTRSVNKEPFAVPSWVLTVFLIVLFVITVVALAYAYSANKRLAEIKARPDTGGASDARSKMGPERKDISADRGQKVPQPRRSPPRRVEQAPVTEEQNDEEVDEAELEVDEEEEQTAQEDEDLTLEEDGAVKHPDILARIRATEDHESQQIKAAAVEGADEITLEVSDGDGKPPVEQPRRPIAQVRCSQCKALIPIYSKERPMRIRCDKCGKEGMIRK